MVLGDSIARARRSVRRKHFPAGADPLDQEPPVLADHGTSHEKIRPPGPPRRPPVHSDLVEILAARDPFQDDAAGCVEVASADGVGDGIGREGCGVGVRRDNVGEPAVPIEISPGFALDAEALKDRLTPQSVTLNDGPILLC